MTTEEFKNRFLPAKNKLFRFAFSLLQNKQEAEDTVQEVYLKMWKMKTDLEKYQSVDALMMTVTKNMCLDRIKLKKNKAVSLNDQLMHNDSVDPQHFSEQSDLVLLVRKLIGNLPDQQQVILHLRDVEGYDFDEITKITGYDLNYIRVNLSRGRKSVREKILAIQHYETNRS